MPAVADRTDGMPPRPHPPAMTPDELRGLLARHGIGQAELAELLGCHPVTVWRWLRKPGKGKGGKPVPINAAAAALIRAKLADREAK